MKIGIIGLPGSGKSTVFEAVTGIPTEKLQHEVGKPHIGVVSVADERLDFLVEVFKPKKVTHVEIVFEDMPGYKVKQIKEVDALLCILGIFSGTNPVKDLDGIESDIILTDLEAIQKRLPILEKEASSGKAELKKEKETLLKCKDHLEKEKPLSELELDKNEAKLIRGYQFLSQRPVLVVANVSEEDMKKPLSKELEDYVSKKGIRIVKFCAQVEEEISELKEEEKADFLKEMGIDKSARDKIIKASFELLDLISFFTIKGPQTRAWAIKKGTTALLAAGKIHSDIQRGFIKAESINFAKFKECGSMQEAKAKGELKLEGKEYIVKDGDIINFRFNV